MGARTPISQPKIGKTLAPASRLAERCSAVIFSHWPDSSIRFFMKTRGSRLLIQTAVKSRPTARQAGTDTASRGARRMPPKASRGEKYRSRRFRKKPREAAWLVSWRRGSLLVPQGLDRVEPGGLDRGPQIGRASCRERRRGSGVDESVT